MLLLIYKERIALVQDEGNTCNYIIDSNKMDPQVS